MSPVKRRKPQEGDVARIRIGPDLWLFGRVVSTKAHASAFEDQEGDEILLYIFRHISSTGVPPRPLLAADLLCPPIITGDDPWRERWFEFVENRPFDPGEVLVQHCFASGIWTPERYFNERGTRLTERSEPCGSLSLTTNYGIELEIREALPKDMVLDLPGPPKANRGNSASDECEFEDDEDEEWCITIYVREWMGLGGYHYEFEEALIKAVEKAKAGEWEGHGFDVDDTFDIRFYGENAEKLIAAITPVLRKWKKRLPSGWSVTQHRGSGPIKEVAIKLGYGFWPLW